MSQLILAVDQGTTGTTVLVASADGMIHGRGYREHPQHFPRPGWVEHDPLAIWQTVLDSTHDALTEAGAAADAIAAVGITNQRETIVAWDSKTGAPLGPTIVWQDRRTADRCDELRGEHAERIRALTGLPLDPYFSATKIEWLLRQCDDVRAAAARGTLRLGTIDSWLVWRMSGGASHITDASNAARTMLYDIHLGAWSPELCDLFGIDEAWLPTVTDSSGLLAPTSAPAFGGVNAPISGIAGDQQSALFGQACLTPGTAKATYGTGAFVLVNSGEHAPTTEQLIATIAWQIDGQRTYTLEGSVFTAGASVQWLRDGLQIIERAPDIEALAGSVNDSGGVVVVPAFAGLGAPVWDADARAAVLGITRGTTRAHIARATIEGTAFRVRQVVDAMRQEGTDVSEMRVDGGMAANDLLLQIQADVLGVTVTRPTHLETTSLGAIFLAALGSGLASSFADVESAWGAARTFEPRGGADQAAVMEAFERFTAGVAAVRSFSVDVSESTRHGGATAMA